MKKIDLHIHTVATFSDAPFTFSLDTFRWYVEEAKLHAVAVTNHDLFDVVQFREIHKALGDKVFPGIEINVEKGHVLVITSVSDIDDFTARTKLVRQKVTKTGDKLTAEELKQIFGDLNKYLVIPHTDKSPPVEGETLAKLRSFFSAGEVDSAKKFMRAFKDETKLPPALFSDARMKVGLSVLPTRQTFVACGEIALGALKECLRDRNKIALSETDGNKLWPALKAQHLSTGLNVVVGARSSGKTYMLNEINDANEGTHYIRQFSLVQKSGDGDQHDFSESVAKRRSSLADEHLAGLKRVLEEIVHVDLKASDTAVDKYLYSLLKSAQEIDREDSFSKAALFNEVDLAVLKTKQLKDLIESVRHVIENEVFRSIVEKHLKTASLKKLAMELIELHWAQTLDNKKMAYVNELTRDVKQVLKLHTAAVQLADVDLYEVSMDQKRVQRFADIVRFLTKPSVIFKESILDFTIVAKREPFANASDVKASVISAKFPLVEPFKKYGDPYGYLKELQQLESLPTADLYKYFVKISYRILNKDGAEVSGGERSEFRLLQEIKDAQNHEMLLIDEPESSFDNLFLKSNVNSLLKTISATMPVVVVTHNSTVGASARPDYLLCTRKEREGGKAVYRIYSGYPTDKTLVSADGRQIKTHDVLLDSLEAGETAYESRREGYEATKD